MKEILRDTIKINGVKIIEYKEELYTANELSAMGVSPKNKLLINRNIDQSYMTDVRKNLKKYNTFLSAIIINDYNMKVLDGQHRLDSFISTAGCGTTNKIIVKFVNIPDEKAEAEYMDQINISNPWSLPEKAKSYSVRYPDSWGKSEKWKKAKDSELKTEFGEKKNLGTRTALHFLKDKVPSKLKQNPENLGDITDAEIEYGNILFSEIIKLIKLFNYPRTIEPLVQAWKVVRRNDTFIDSLVKSVQTLIPGGYSLQGTGKRALINEFNNLYHRCGL